MLRTASAVWNGSGKEGKGALTTQSGVLSGQPYSFTTRFANEDGQAGTNPEELIAAAHAGCFTMALSFQLAGEGHTAEELRTEASLTLEKQGEGFTITRIALRLTGRVPGISADDFQRLATVAKEICPVSKVLNAELTLEATLAGA